MEQVSDPERHDEIHVQARPGHTVRGARQRSADVVRDPQRVQRLGNGRQRGYEIGHESPPRPGQAAANGVGQLAAVVKLDEPETDFGVVGGTQRAGDGTARQGVHGVGQRQRERQAAWHAG